MNITSGIASKPFLAQVSGPSTPDMFAVCSQACVKLLPWMDVMQYLSYVSPIKTTTLMVTNGNLEQEVPIGRKEQIKGGRSTLWKWMSVAEYVFAMQKVEVQSPASPGKDSQCPLCRGLGWSTQVASLRIQVAIKPITWQLVSSNQGQNPSLACRHSQVWSLEAPLKVSQVWAASLCSQNWLKTTHSWTGLILYALRERTVVQ